MFHHHSQQQGPQSFSNGPRPHQSHPKPPSDMMTQVMGYQFPRPTQLPDELESALAIRGSRDMDHRLIDHMNPTNHQGSGISQHGSYGSTTLTSDSQPGHQQGINWSSYETPTKLFANPPPSSCRQPQQNQGPQQQRESSHTGISLSGWIVDASDSQSPQVRHPPGSRSSGGGDGQGLYTPESAGSILASFGLSNEDLEVLSHYPDEQLTPDTLPFILRDIQINKSGKQKTGTSTSSSSFSRSIHDMPLQGSQSLPLARSRSPEVPSLLAVTQTAGKVIDYGHASRAEDESSSKETFKREPLSSERTVKMYPTSSTLSSTTQRMDKAERRHVHLEHTEPSKHGDRDYRRANTNHHKNIRSPVREIPPSTKSRNLDRDYRHDGHKRRPSSETRSEDSSRRSLSSSSGSKQHGNSSKKLPTPTMISDFSAVSPKVYPHTCSLCCVQCDQEKDWIEHINTVNHTAACRDLRNKYPDWKPNLPSRQYGSTAPWDPNDPSPSPSANKSLSCSPTPSPPHTTHRVGAHPSRPHGKLYTPHHRPRYNHYSDQGNRLDHSDSHSPFHLHRPSSSSREYRLEKRDRESSGLPSRSGVKRPYSDTVKCFTHTSQHPSSLKSGLNYKHGLSQSNTKTGTKSGTKTGTKIPKTAKATDTSPKPPPTKKKKKLLVTSATWNLHVAYRLVYLTGIPINATEQDVTNLVGSFGQINNVILMPCSEDEKGEGQKASVCMVKAEDAQALANSTNLSIRDQQVTVSTAKMPEGELFSDVSNSKLPSGQEKGAAGEEIGCDADQKSSNEKGMVLITGLPEGSWSESDIFQLIQPFGTPSDIIPAAQIGKVLVSVPDMDIAEEIVKVHTFIPAKIKGTELKIVHIKQHIGLKTPVALYNLLMGSMDLLENPGLVGWGRLLVISNVPNKPSCSSEVQKLVQRFGTVIKTLVLKNMVICEMATVAMALSVYKRFQTFPCIIQNNPLIFSRNHDRKTQMKVITADPDLPEDTPENGKSSQTAAAVGKQPMTHKEKSVCPLKVMGEVVGGTDEKIKTTDQMVGKDTAFEEIGSKDKVQKDELAVALSDSSAALDSKPEEILDADTSVTSAAETVMETEEQNDILRASEAEAGNDKSQKTEETGLSSSDDKAPSSETVIPQLPEVTKEMVTRPASTCGEKEKEQTETEQGEKATKEKEELVEICTEEETKRQERERKERELRKEKEERERREKRPWERARREKEWDDRARREREKRMDERREWERRERERRERKRAYVEGLSGSRSSCKSEEYTQKTRRDVQCNNAEPENKMVEEEDDFPFNMSDFVTVDEVGEVADLPHSPSAVIPTEEEEVQQDTPKDTPMEVGPVNLVEQVSVSEAVIAPSVESSDALSVLTPAKVPLSAEVSSNLTPSHVDSSPSQTPVPTCRPEALETGNIENEHLPTPADPGSPVESAPADPSTREAGSAEGRAETEDSAPSHNQAGKGDEDGVVVVLEKTEEKDKVPNEEDEGKAAAASETGKQEITKDHVHTRGEGSVRSSSQTKPPISTTCSLPPFDPSNPVGMEYLVPKTGFFCKLCNRFFSGTKEAEISHCKTAKHYENLQKYLQTLKASNVTA